MRRLPESVEEVQPPPIFSVSQISSSEGCGLRLVLGETGDASALPAHPAGKIGRVVHDFVNDTIRENPSSLNREKLGDRLEERLHSFEVHLDGRKSFPVIGDLLDTITPLQWARKRSRALDMLHRSIPPEDTTISPESSGSTRGRAEPVSIADIDRKGAWTEISGSDEKLRLKGRIDLLIVRDREVEIHDFKTGRIFERESKNIKPSLVRQMWLYGLMVKRVRPDDRVSLYLHGDRVHEISFSEDERNRVRALLQSRYRQLGTDGSARAEEIAEPGSECFFCQFRHRCTAYQDFAPEHWNEDDPKLPYDSWGRVEEVDVATDGYLNLTMVDDAGRQIRVLRLDQRRPVSIEAGRRLWFFGLESVAGAGSSYRARHPVNFYEIAQSRKADRAWSLRAYLGES